MDYQSVVKRPPPNQRHLTDEQVLLIDEMHHKTGILQKKIAEHLGIHPRTVMAAINRKGAYASIPRDSI